VHPLRVSFCTYNLWNTERWPEREPALRDLLTPALSKLEAHDRAQLVVIAYESGIVTPST
jgi:hypothetical protein